MIAPPLESPGEPMFRSACLLALLASPALAGGLTLTVNSTLEPSI